MIGRKEAQNVQIQIASQFRRDALGPYRCIETAVGIGFSTASWVLYCGYRWGWLITSDLPRRVFTSAQRFPLSGLLSHIAEAAGNGNMAARLKSWVSSRNLLRVTSLPVFFAG